MWILDDINDGNFYGSDVDWICVICFSSLIWFYIWYFNWSRNISSNALKLIITNNGQNIQIWNIWYIDFGYSISYNNLK
jgi:hypothetical protein